MERMSSSALPFKRRNQVSALRPSLDFRALRGSQLLGLDFTRKALLNQSPPCNQDGPLAGSYNCFVPLVDVSDAGTEFWAGSHLHGDIETLVKSDSIKVEHAHDLVKAVGDRDVKVTPLPGNASSARHHTCAVFNPH